MYEKGRVAAAPFDAVDSGNRRLRAEGFQHTDEFGVHAVGSLNK